MPQLRALAVIVVSLAASAAPAHASRFDGSCQVVGTGGFASGAGYLPGPNQWWMEGRGGCTGRLDGVSVVDYPVSLRIGFDDPLAGCAASLTTGEGTLEFGNPPRRLAFTQRQLGPLATVTGRRGGSGAAYLTAYTQLARQDPAAVFQCAAGDMRFFAAEWALKTFGTVTG